MPKKNKRIYADYAAGMPILPQAQSEFLKSFRIFGNPSSIHAEGRVAKNALENARKDVATFFNVKADEVFFTASGTESNFIAISGVIESVATSRGGYGEVGVVVSTIEHPSVRETLLLYEAKGVVVKWIPPQQDGRLDVTLFEEAVTPNTALVILHHVNSEIGTIQPVSEIATVCKKKGSPIIHVDACQSAPWLPVHVDTLRVDTVAIDSTKVGGPRGVGAIAVIRGTNLNPIMKGGGQEGGLRSGTENIPGIIGFAKALSIVVKNRKKVSGRVLELRDYFIKLIQESVLGVVINGTLKYRVPNNINISFLGVNSDVLVTKLDVLGVATSTGTACAVGEYVSPVVLAIAPNEKWRALSAVRFTLGFDSKIGDIKKMKDAYKEALIYAKKSFRTK